MAPIFEFVDGNPLARLFKIILQLSRSVLSAFQQIIKKEIGLIPKQLFILQSFAINELLVGGFLFKHDRLRRMRDLQFSKTENQETFNGMGEPCLGS